MWSTRPQVAGERFAESSIVVKRGKPPAVHKKEDSITIVMDVAPHTSQTAIRLVLRCERNGDIFVSIDRDPPRRLG